jgi:hypothetical protein
MVNGFMTVDTPSQRRRDWIAGVAYRLPPVRLGAGQLLVNTGWQRWLFPSVLTGVRDHLLATTGVYRTKLKLPITVTADNWVLLQSPFRRGVLTYVQANVSHTLWEGSGMRLLLKHGPATTYSTTFWDRPGWRVLRYGGGLTIEGRGLALEGSLRQQAAIAPRIPDYTYWSVVLSKKL